ncbi:hypothetical protein [Salinispora arenicola]|uniref:hypothetical protein n=1 Tax=Salinispora arenicola TaxID=168697 RepID=UPI00036A0EF2|nr:hypothetical protein [Salinispora arenicola]
MKRAHSAAGTHDALIAQAIDVLTSLARTTRVIPVETTEPVDFADLAAHALTSVAANLGGSVDTLLAARPGSWEADLVRRLVEGTGRDYILAWRSEPFRRPHCRCTPIDFREEVDSPKDPDEYEAAVEEAGKHELSEEQDALLEEAIKVLTSLARQTRPRGRGTPAETIDFAHLVAHVLTSVAANLGSVETLLAARPDSWEADLVRRLVEGTVADVETIPAADLAPEDQILAWRTEPYRLRPFTPPPGGSTVADVKTMPAGDLVAYLHPIDQPSREDTLAAVAQIRELVRYLAAVTGYASSQALPAPNVVSDVALILRDAMPDLAELFLRLSARTEQFSNSGRLYTYRDDGNAHAYAYAIQAEKALRAVASTVRALEDDLDAAGQAGTTFNLRAE